MYHLESYINIIKEELIVSVGCTEPIAVAYIAAKSAELLGQKPDKIVVECSANIIKNAKSVSIPNCKELKGIIAATAVGTIVKKSENVLRLLENVTEQDIKDTRELLEKKYIQLKLLETTEKLHIITTCYAKEEYAKVEIQGAHTNIVKMEKNGEVVFENTENRSTVTEEEVTDRGILNVKDICAFVEDVDFAVIKPLLVDAIENNRSISQEGLTNDYGNRVAKTMQKYYANDIYTQVKTAGASGSDARMSGCAFPVSIVSGSGNQGMTSIAPVIVYAKYKNATEEMLYRAIIMSLLITIHQKTGIGKLSAYCGAVSAAAGTACAMTYLECGANLEKISQTLINTIGVSSGIVCDGAKPSCAAKIAVSLEAGNIGHLMAMDGFVFDQGVGIIKNDVESTIKAIGKMASVGMKETDAVILDIMIND